MRITPYASCRDDRGAVAPGLVIGLAVVVLVIGAYLIAGQRKADTSSAPVTSRTGVSVALPTRPGTTTDSRKQKSPTSSSTPATTTEPRHRHGAAEPSLAPTIAAPATAAAQAAALVTMMNSFDSTDSGPNAWVSRSGRYLTPGAQAWFRHEVGGLSGDYYAYWSQVVDDHGSQSATVSSVEIDPSQKATNTATHLSVLVIYTVTHKGFVYPDPASDPSISGQSAVLNMVLSGGVWQASYVADAESAPADYGRLALSK